MAAGVAGQAPEVRQGKLRYWSIPAAALLALSGWLFVEEGDRTTAYWDSVGEVWTICRGLTGPDVYEGLTLTPAECRARESAFINKAAARMGHCLHVPLSVEEWIAWGDFSWNVGTGTFCSSTAVRLLNQERRAEACKQIPRFKYAGGLDCSVDRRCRGVWRRRLREQAMCMTGA